MSDDLAALRDRLARDVKLGKAAGKQPQRSENLEQEQRIQPEPLDWDEAFRTVATHARFPSETGASTGPAQIPPALPFEALELLMRRALSIVASGPSSETSTGPEATSLRSLFSSSYLCTLISDLYTIWEHQTSHAQVKMRVSLDLILAVSAPDRLDFPGVLAHLLGKLAVDPPDRRRHLHIMEVALKYGTVQDYAIFATRSDSMSDDVRADVLRYFLYTITLDEEMAQLAGKVAVSWVNKCWATGSTEVTVYWTAPLLETCRRSPKELQKVSLYVLPGLFAKRKAAFRGFLRACHGLVDDQLAVPEEEEDLRTALEVVKVGNALNLVEADAAPPSTLERIPFPTDLLRACLLRASPTLRSSALSVLVLSPSSSIPLPRGSFPLLSDFFRYSLGEEDPEFRMHLSHLTGRLLLRLRDSSLKAQRTAAKGKDGTAAPAAAYVELVKEWVTWLVDLVSRINLNPARPFRIKMNSLRILDIALQARVDLRFRVGDLDASITGYSTYRKAATTSISLFQSKHRQVEQRNSQSSTPASGKSDSFRSASPAPPAAPVTASAAESGWPFAVDVVNARVTQMLLRQLLSTYTALRFLVITTLERFPSPLPGYEGPEGVERAKRELLAPALRMIRSGREAEASAGASIVGLVWRKWVLEDLRGLEEDGSAAQWTLGATGGWQSRETAPDGLDGEKQQATPGFAFINSLLDLAEAQLQEYADNLGSAAASSPMHGTLLALRHLLISIPKNLWDALSGPEVRRTLFHRVLAVIRRVWEVTSPILAASGPGDEADNDEARALRFERVVTEEQDPGATDGSTGGSAGPQYKIILNACWRAMKEAGELLETILRIPSEFGTEAFEQVWHLDEICAIGDLFGSWMRLARHRGTVANLHPCYTRSAEALMAAGKDWAEVQQLPRVWLQDYLQAIVSAGISTTRRSAALPFVILGLMMAILPYDRTAFDSALDRLFGIAESDGGEISDESRVHAMNTIRTIYLDSKGGVAAAKLIERGFMLSLKLFWSSNWILRNVAMMLYATLVTRALHPRRVNLEREPDSLAKRVSIADFFGRYPRLHATLLTELERGLRDSLDDLPSSNLDSPLFAILMLFGLLQTRESAEGTEETVSLSAPFIPLVRACARSRVWKIRGAAGDALTGLTAPSRVESTCCDLLDSIAVDADSISANELHGRVVQVLRLLQSSPALSEFANGQVATVYARVVQRLLPDPASLGKRGASFRPKHPFATLAACMQIALRLEPTSVPEAAFDVACHTLADAQDWSADAFHLPSAEEYLWACWAVVHHGVSSDRRPEVICRGLAHRSLEVRRETLKALAASPGLLNAPARSGALVPSALKKLLLDEAEAGDARVFAAELLQEADTSPTGHPDPPPKEEFAAYLRGSKDTANVPLRQAVLPLLAATGGSDAVQQRQILELLEQNSRMEESVEEREAAAAALIAFTRRHPSTSLPANLLPIFQQVAIRLLQDDDPTVRERARMATGHDLIEGKAVECVLERAGAETVRLLDLEADAEFKEDLALLSNPSSLLFAVEKPNIFRDPLFLPSALRDLQRSGASLFGKSSDPTGSSPAAAERLSALASLVAPATATATAASPIPSNNTPPSPTPTPNPNPTLSPGPLGFGGNELVSRWVSTLLPRAGPPRGADADAEVGALVAATREEL
ncbi:hypothetical protein JCM8202_003123 [Rhodotorula sphaerocarpa]